ncbi:hypothetical protein CVT26_013212 [Gymnopilus dilepis]|uniref:Uncharacterized protein n=1 Tax=Gymnopilus dilepis TaxID=231916 RepID=A0A409WUZ8_9AGAR|nr:hypothetical protein CVT26_013212 [Gymnopilus dilepis]
MDRLATLNLMLCQSRSSDTPPVLQNRVYLDETVVATGFGAIAARSWIIKELNRSTPFYLERSRELEKVTDKIVKALDAVNGGLSRVEYVLLEQRRLLEKISATYDIPQMFRLSASAG